MGGYRINSSIDMKHANSIAWMPSLPKTMRTVTSSL
jgi:hypothetical protein